jgi:hypothetical protein
MGTVTYRSGSPGDSFPSADIGLVVNSAKPSQTYYASKIGQVKKRREEVTRKWRGSKTGGSKETR